MTAETYTGEIKARIVEVRFAFSGKVAAVARKEGDSVRKGELLATLDRKILQTELDKQLADYEKIRADFEIFNLKQSGGTDDLAKYLKAEKQAQLNASVKEVELAKAKLDQADLISPLSGVIVDDGNLVSGINVTPASSSIKILDTSSYYFEFEIDQSQLLDFKTLVEVKVNFPGLEKEISGKTKEIVSSLSTKPGKFLVTVDPADKTGLLLGLQGEVKIV